MRHHVLAAVVFASTPVVGLAQDTPKAEVFGGYAFTRSDGESLHGWNASLSASLNGWLAIAADLSGLYATLDGTDVSRTFLLAGPRLTRRGNNLTLFAQVLVGGVRTSAGIEVLGVSISQKSTDLGGTVGAGLDVKVAGSWAVRLQGELALIKGEPDGEGAPGLRGYRVSGR
jgi:opacity protein-like surface antigen